MRKSAGTKLFDQMKLSIIIPAHDEEQRLRSTLDEYLCYFDKVYWGEFEIIIVPNGCSDNTLEIAKEYQSKRPQVGYSNIDEKVGKGGAVVRGFRIARGEVVAFVDADGATRPEELHKLVNRIGTCDVVIGSRWLKGSVIIARQNIVRIAAGRGFNLAVRLMLSLPFADTQCGAKAFKKSAVDAIVDKLQVMNFAFDTELLYVLKKCRYKIEEMPITWEDKRGSTVRLHRIALQTIWTIVRLRFRKGICD